MNDGMKIPIIPVLQHYGLGDLSETLGWKQCKCPFHGDRNASAGYIASENGQAFKCHGCPAQGDAIALVRQQEQLDYKEALQFLEQIVGQGLAVSNDAPAKRYRPVRIGDTGELPAVAAPKRRKKTLRLREV